jgi:hypothetical protein
MRIATGCSELLKGASGRNAEALGGAVASADDAKCFGGR